MVRHVGIAERRARLVTRHGLAGPSQQSTVPEVADSVVALHATDPTSVYLGIRARCEGINRDDVARAMYDDRSVVRILGMRRTMFVASLDTAPLLDRACARPLAESERRRTVKLLRDADVVPEPEAWFDRVAADTLAALAAAGEASASELTEQVPDLATKIPVGQGTSWATEIGTSTRVLFFLATTGRIVRARPQGSWVSSLYRWSLMDRWVSLPELDVSDAGARALLIERYLARFGPATETDVVWWTGWTKTRTRAALAAVEAEEVDLGGESTGFVLPGDEEAPTPDRPVVSLLPSLDSTVMGWKEREWYLGNHEDRLFDRNGNAGPTVWVDGRVVGGWAQSPDGAVVWRLLDDVDDPTAEVVAAEAESLTQWLGGTVVSPRFPTPLQKELAAG